jgi:integrase
MARETERLTDVQARKTSKPGRYPDGSGLYLQVTETGTKSWLYRYKVNGRTRWKGLGVYGPNDVTLIRAREKAGECRQLRREGIDPIDHYRAVERQNKLEELKGVTFRQCAAEHIESRKDTWTNEKHAQQWTKTLETYAYPIIGDLPVADIDINLIERILSPIWQTKNETANRVRQRIEGILDRAIVKRWREGPNPAVWRGSMSALLPAPKNFRAVKHHAAMPFGELPKFYKTLLAKTSISSLALRMLIQSGVRSREARGAHLDEFDLEKMIWTIPADRMKGKKGKKKPHKIPITIEMLAIFNLTEPHRRKGLLFPGQKGNNWISDTSLRKILHSQHKDLSVHGFRSTFRDWAAEKTDFQHEVCEACLAHAVGTRVEKAYRRGTFFEKRQELMESWCAFSLGNDKKAKVVSINSAAS